ncbi:MAG TPA: cellulase family glycosylhydrolase [Phnomibacter sp.]|nr:cellulase family glycosylhydrolase [Phnomibacter sp.]
MISRVVAFMAISALWISCKKKQEAEPQLSVDPLTLVFASEGNSQSITIDCNSNWSITNPASAWLQVDKTSGQPGTVVAKLTAAENAAGGASRSATITINATNGQARRVNVSQPATIYPSYNTAPKAPDSSGMGSTAQQLAAKFKLGWNIGNTLEAPGGETGWGNPAITEDYIKLVKQQGFTAIRLPCAWDWYHVTDAAKAKIDPAWLNRVKEVVGYCVNNGLYVLLNIHWDGGWLENNCTPAKKDSVNAKQKAYWEQIATALRDFDEHLMFASANEPDVQNQAQMDVLHSYHQTFVNAVRSTGGKNSYRVLVVQGPSTSIEKSNDWMNMPTDVLPNKLMAEVHFYTPSQFCILQDGDASWGKMFYYWGAGNHSTIEPDRNATWGEESEVDKSFALAKQKFIDKGIPVILGEYGAYRRNENTYKPKDLEKHNNSVDYWITYVTKKAIANGLLPFWWDTGGALDRRLNTVKDQRTINAILEGGK